MTDSEQNSNAFSRFDGIIDSFNFVLKMGITNKHELDLLTTATDGKAQIFR